VSTPKACTFSSGNFLVFKEIAGTLVTCFFQKYGELMPTMFVDRMVFALTFFCVVGESNPVSFLIRQDYIQREAAELASFSKLLA
jgi:hypothetical protein